MEFHHIHLEEDAGKSIHDLSPTDSYIDLNRAGTPLIEIVTEPCIHSAEDAFLYVSEVRKLVRWLGICDGNMEEGSLRCDANISLTDQPADKIDIKKLHPKTEIKNLNARIKVEQANLPQYKVRAVILAPNVEGPIDMSNSVLSVSGQDALQLLGGLEQIAPWLE